MRISIRSSSPRRPTRRWRSCTTWCAPARRDVSPLPAVLLGAAAHAVLRHVVELLDQHVLDHVHAEPLVDVLDDLAGERRQVLLLEVAEVDHLAREDQLEGL